MAEDTRQVIFVAVRKRLTESATLAAMVGSQAISVSQRRPPTTCPAIRLRVVGATGDRPISILEGDVYLNIYSTHRNPPAELASIYTVVFNRLAESVTNLTTTDVGLGKLYEQSCEYPIWDEEGTDRFYLAARYRFYGQNKS